jgi:hypothetical protein
MCNGLMVPVVAFDQIYFFDRDSLIKGIPRPDSIPAEREEPFRTAAGELFDRIMQMADNAGGTDEDRALNYLAVRYPAIYATAADAFGRNASLTAVTARPSRLRACPKSLLRPNDIDEMLGPPRLFRHDGSGVFVERELSDPFRSRCNSTIRNGFSGLLGHALIPFQERDDMFI